MKTALTALPSKLGGFWGTLGPKEKWSSIAVAAGILVVTTIFFVRSETPAVNEAPAPALVDEPTTPSFPPVDEPLSVLFTENRVLAPDNGSKSIALMNVDDAPFLVTEKSIVSLKTQESIAAPESIHLATAMNDLDAIFMLGESGSLYLYSVTNKKLQSNALPLPAGAKIDALGAYLTYLYVLDQKAGVIYRFPRAEGGFGAPVTWSKESVDSGENHAFAVYENIVTADTKGSLVLYARGKNTGTAFGGTRLFYSADALAFDTKTGDLLALDRYNKRIIRWSATGTLLAQYYQESFADAETFSVSPDGSELFVSNQSSSSAWKIQ
jgi:hypothetical protein